MPDPDPLELKVKRNRFIKIPPGLLSDLISLETSSLVTGNLYFHPNPLLRGIFWKRLEKIFQLCLETPAESVLDLGCGDGVLLPSLSRFYPRVWGMDLQIGNARRIMDYYHLDNVELVEGDFLRHDFNPGMFDLVIAADIWEHQRDLDVFFRRTLRILKPGGIMIGSFPVENAVYRLGRKVFRITPPEDHYQKYGQVVAQADKYFKKEKSGGVPYDFFSLFKVIKYLSIK